MGSLGPTLMRLSEWQGSTWTTADLFARLDCRPFPMTTMIPSRFDRQVRFFGRKGQEQLARSRVAIVGVGGLGSHVVQQLALLGVGTLVPIDPEALELSNRNRLVGARKDDPIPGTLKVDISRRTAENIDEGIVVEPIPESFVSERGFAGVIGADYVFGCVDREGARLVLKELCSAYSKPYTDLSTDVVKSDSIKYGGQVCIAWNGGGCLSCLGILDRAEAEADLAGPAERQRRQEAYGVPHDALGAIGPSVASINGVVASLGVTEFMLAVTDQRAPRYLLTYHGDTGKVTVSTDTPAPNCYYCHGLRGLGDAADVQRYVREGVGDLLQ